MAVVTMKNLLESGVHFGHQVKRWDPRMKKYIFAERNGIHIIDLQKTIVSIKDAYDAVRKVTAAGKSVLFVGTKKQAQQAIAKEAERWENIPGYDYSQIEDFLKTRLPLIDNYIKNL